MLLTSLVVASAIVVFGISYLVMKFPYDVVKEGEYWYLLKDEEKIYKSTKEQDCWDRIKEVYWKSSKQIKTSNMKKVVLILAVIFIVFWTQTSHSFIVNFPSTRHNHRKS